MSGATTPLIARVALARAHRPHPSAPTGRRSPGGTTASIRRCVGAAQRRLSWVKYWGVISLPFAWSFFGRPRPTEPAKNRCGQVSPSSCSALCAVVTGTGTKIHPNHSRNVPAGAHRRRAHARVTQLAVEPASHHLAGPAAPYGRRASRRRLHARPARYGRVSRLLPAGLVQAAAHLSHLAEALQF